MAVLLKDALKPNLHADPRGRPRLRPLRPVRQHRPRQQHRSSPTAPRSRARDILVTEAGFGADMGAEKFFDIKCRGVGPDVRRRGDRGHDPRAQDERRRGQDRGRQAARPGAAREQPRGRPAGRRQPRQADRERARVRRAGGRGDQRLPDRHARRDRGRPRGRARGRRPRRRGRAPLHRRRRRCRGPRPRGLGRGRGGEPRLPAALPRRHDACEDKIETIATRIYGADGVDYLPAAAKSLKLYEDMGFGHLPVCMAKTQYSLSPRRQAPGPAHGLPPPDPRGPPRPPAPASSPRSAATCARCRASTRRPGGERIDIDADGNVVGLF